MSAAWPALAGLLSGAVLMAAFRRSRGAHSLRAAVNRIEACLLEFWLYVDEPLVALRTWKDLFAAQARLLRALLYPTLAATLAMAPVLYALEGFYGHSPLPPGSPALVTARLAPGAATPALIVPDGIAVETLPVRVPARREVSWRIRPVRQLSAYLVVQAGPRAVRKSIAAGAGPQWVSPRRAAGLRILLSPFEAPLAGGPVEWIEIAYPTAAVTLFGIPAHWSVWFGVFSLVGALLLRR